jgi:AcrR family transcriptional regulator
MSRADSQARTRAALLSAGKQLFTKRGFNATTVEAISERASFSRGAFYANFYDKADLFLTILERERDRDFGQIARELETIPDEQILIRLGEWMTKVLISDPLRPAFAEFSLSAGKQPKHRRRLAENVRAMRAVNTQMVARYCERHGVQLTVDYATFATMVTATIGGFADQIRLDPEAASIETVRLTLAALWNGVQQES